MPGGVTRIVSHPAAASFTPTNLVDPSGLLSGTPNDRGFTQFVSEDRRIECGVWACDVYKERIPSYPVDELFVVIEGTVVVTVEGDDPQVFSVGDAFVIRRGTACTFDVRAPFLKYWMTYDTEPSADPSSS